MNEVINGMLDLLDVEKEKTNRKGLVDECFEKLDVSQDGQISKSKI